MVQNATTQVVSEWLFQHRVSRWFVDGNWIPSVIDAKTAVIICVDLTSCLRCRSQQVYKSINPVPVVHGKYSLFSFFFDDREQTLSTQDLLWSLANGKHNLVHIKALQVSRLQWSTF